MGVPESYQKSREIFGSGFLIGRRFSTGWETQTGCVPGAAPRLKVQHHPGV